MPFRALHYQLIKNKKATSREAAFYLFISDLVFISDSGCVRSVHSGPVNATGSSDRCMQGAPL